MVDGLSCHGQFLPTTLYHGGLVLYGMFSALSAVADTLCCNSSKTFQWQLFGPFRPLLSALLGVNFYKIFHWRIITDSATHQTSLCMKTEAMRMFFSLMKFTQHIDPQSSRMTSAICDVKYRYSHFVKLWLNTKFVARRYFILAKLVEKPSKKSW